MFLPIYDIIISDIFIDDKYSNVKIRIKASFHPKFHNF